MESTLLDPLQFIVLQCDLDTKNLLQPVPLDREFEVMVLLLQCTSIIDVVAQGPQHELCGSLRLWHQVMTGEVTGVSGI